MPLLEVLGDVVEHRLLPAVEAIRAAVSNRHGLSAADVKFVPAGAIPRTTSGKLARRACRAQYLAGELAG